MLAKLKGGYEDIWKGIIRPLRDEYKLTELGSKEFSIEGKKYKRSDLTLKNKRGLSLECSHFEPANRVAKELPCVIYLHGNSSSRIEALPAVDLLLPLNITLFCFDFAGCGLSEGEYISLGWHEKDDLETVISHLRATGSVSTIGLWGRSMGAVTALMHVERDPTVAGMVIDSAFSDLNMLVEELARIHSGMPKFIISSAMSFVRKTIQNKAQFDINELSPIKNVQSGYNPSFFVAAKSDRFILPHHTQDLYKKYSGDKNLVLVDGDHNSVRPQFLLDSIAIFFFNTLLCEHLPKDMATKDLIKGTEINIQEAVLSLTQSYVKHNQKREECLQLGDENQSEDVIEGFGEEDWKAMEESFSQLIREELPEEKFKQDAKEVKELEKKVENFTVSQESEDEYEIILASPKNLNSNA